MKKMLLLMVPVIGFASSSCLASDGVVVINGKLSQATCSVNNGTPDLTVNLPKLSTSSLPYMYSSAGTTKFSLTLSNCIGASVAYVGFEAVGQPLGTDYLLLNKGTAQNVKLIVQTPSGTAVNFNVPSGQQGLGFHSIVTGATIFDFYVSYYAGYSELPTAGSVTAQMVYSIYYE